MRDFTAVLLVVAGILLLPARAQELHYFGEDLIPVFAVLQNGHLSGAMELERRCDPPHLLGFPQFNAASTSSSPLAALRELAATDPAMRVSQDANGTIRMTDKGVPNDLLEVKISHIAFQDSYSATAAVRAILSAPEIRSFMAAHDVAAPQLTAGGGISGNPVGHWPNDAPHISGSLDNVTLLEALDRVLAAFPGEIFVYWNCPRTQEERERDRAIQRAKHDEATAFTDCPASFMGDIPPGLPNPFCMRGAIPAVLARLFFTPTEPSHERTVFIYFFRALKGFKGKTVVQAG